MPRLIAASSRRRERFLDVQVPAVWAAYLGAYMPGVDVVSAGSVALWGDLCGFRRPGGVLAMIQARVADDADALARFCDHVGVYMPAAVEERMLVNAARVALGSGFPVLIRLGGGSFLQRETPEVPNFWHVANLLGVLVLAEAAATYWQDAVVRDVLVAYFVQVPVARLMADLGSWLSGQNVFADGAGMHQSA